MIACPTLSSSIRPIPSWPQSGVSVLFADFCVVPNTTLDARYQVFDANSNSVSVGRVNLTAAQYSGWNGNVDDAVYLPACFATNLGLTLI